MNGLLDFIKTPEGQGLLGAAFAGMAGARRGQPWNTAGAAGLGGLLGYNRALDNQAEQAREASATKFRDMQIAEMMRKHEIEAKRAPILAKIGSYKNGAPTVDNNSAPYSYKDAQNELLAGGDLEGYKYLQGMEEKPQLVTVQTPQGPMQRWLRPGETTGTDVGAPADKEAALPWYVRQGSNGYSIDPAYADLERTKAAYGRPPAQPMQPITYQNERGEWVWGTIADARGRPADRANVPLQGRLSAAKGAGSEGGKSGIEMNVGLYDAAMKASQALPKTEELIRLLEGGNVNMGMMADFKQGIDRARSLLGGSAGAKNASDTQIADVLMGSEVFPLIQSLGIGAKGMDTPAERQFMRQVLTGELSLEKDTLLRMAKMRRDSMRNAVNRFNQKVDSGELDTFFDTTQIRKNKFDAPWAVQSPAQNPGGRTPTVSNW